MWRTSRSAPVVASLVVLFACSDVVAPGGTGRVAFLHFDPQNAGDMRIYSVDVMTGVLHDLSHRPAGRSNPAWSPNGRRIAFSSDQDSTGSEVFVMNQDGSGVTRLTDMLGPSFCPSWSPDGSRIVFDFEGGATHALYVMNADGSDTNRILQGTQYMYRCPVWSPDGSRIAFVGRDSAGGPTDGEIFLVNSNGTGETDWSNNLGYNDADPTWSPDGTKLAFYSNRNGVSGIYVMNADGSDLQPFATSPGVNQCPAWSPDGTWIAFNSTRDGRPQIFAKTIDGSVTRRLAVDAGDDLCPRWQP